MMRKFLIVVLLTLVPATLLAGELQKLLTGVLPAGTLADADKTGVLQMDGRGFFNQLSLQARVTRGTSTDMEVRCEVSFDNIDWSWLSECPSGVCVAWERNFDLTNAELLCSVAPITDVCITINVPSNYPYIKCTFDDAADGTGTVTVKAVKGRQ